MKSIRTKFAAFKKWFVSKPVIVKALIILLTAGVIWSVYKKFTVSDVNQTDLQTVKAAKGTIVSTVSASGTVVSANTFNIKTSASGVIKKVYVKDGDFVAKGQKIAEVELDLDGEQQYAQALASYISANNQLRSANNSLRNATASLSNTYDQIKGHENDESFTMIETRTKAEVARDNAYDSIKSASANLTNADFNLKANSPVIIAPTSGTVQGLTIAEGLPLSAQTTTTGTRTGQRIASIVKSGNPLISVNLSEIDVPKIKVGQKATVIFDSISDKTFTGIVTAIDRTGTTSNNVTSYPSIIKLDSGSEQILSNMATTANIIIDTKSNVLLIPASAVQSQNGRSTARVLKDGRTTTVDVTLGLSSDTETEVISGLSEGDEVITGSYSSQSSANQERSVFSGGFGGQRFIMR